MPTPEELALADRYALLLSNRDTARPENDPARLVPLVPPVPSISQLGGEIDDTVWNLQFAVVVRSGGGGATLTYTIVSKVGSGTGITLFSGDATTLPRAAAMARHFRFGTGIFFRVLDTATGLAANAYITVPAQRPEVTDTGNPRRDRPYDDTFYAPRGSDAAGNTVAQTVGEFGGKAIARLFAKPLAGDADNLDAVGNGVTYARPLATRIAAGKPLIDFAEGIHSNKNQDNIADTATRFAAVEANANNTEARTSAAVGGAQGTKLAGIEDGANVTETRTAAAIAGQGALATKSAVDLASTEVTNKNLDNIANTATRFAAAEAGANNTESRTAADVQVGAGKAVLEAGANKTETRTAADTAAVAGTAAATVQSGAARGQGGFSNATGGLVSTATESAGKAVARLFAKPLAGDADTADSVGTGIVRRVTTLNEATGGGRGFGAVNANNRLQGNIESTVGIFEGGASFKIYRHREEITVQGPDTDGNTAVTFAQTYQNAPMIVLKGGQYVSYSSALGGTVMQRLRLQALDVTASGFTSRIQIVSVGVTTARSADFPSGNVTTGAGGTTEANLGANAPANDNTYTINYRVAITLSDLGVDPIANLTVALDTNDGSGYVERATFGYQRAVEGTGTWNTESKPIVVSGLGVNDVVRIRAKGFSVLNAIGSFEVRGADGAGANPDTRNGVTWTTAVDTINSAIPSTGDHVIWVAQEVV